MIENVRARVDIKLVNKWDTKWGARMLIARPNFKRFTIFDEECVAIELKKMHVLMDKPIIVGMAILDISKVTMYEFVYGFLKPKYKNKCETCYADTDGLVVDIETKDFYNDIRQTIEDGQQIYDTSDYGWPNRYNIPPKNNKIPGLFKDELKGRIITGNFL